MTTPKDYEPVEDRLREFWTQHPYGRVITELLHHADGSYIVKASVYVGNELRNDPPTATGLAQDSVDLLPANLKASALEVCETSAIGRALANMGYAAKGKRPSREEMQKSWGNLASQAAPAGGAAGADHPADAQGEDAKAGPAAAGEASNIPEASPPAGEITDDTLEALIAWFKTPGKALIAVRAAGYNVRSLGGLSEADAREFLGGVLT